MSEKFLKVVARHKQSAKTKTTLSFKLYQRLSRSELEAVVKVENLEIVESIYDERGRVCKLKDFGLEHAHIKERIKIRIDGGEECEFLVSWKGIRAKASKAKDGDGDVIIDMSGSMPVFDEAHVAFLDLAQKDAELLITWESAQQSLPGISETQPEDYPEEPVELDI